MTAAQNAVRLRKGACVVCRAPDRSLIGIFGGPECELRGVCEACREYAECRICGSLDADPRTLVLPEEGRPEAGIPPGESSITVCRTCFRGEGEMKTTQSEPIVIWEDADENYHRRAVLVGDEVHFQHPLTRSDEWVDLSEIDPDEESEELRRLAASLHERATEAEQAAGQGRLRLWGRVKALERRIELQGAHERRSSRRWKSAVQHLIDLVSHAEVDDPARREAAEFLKAEVDYHADCPTCRSSHGKFGPRHRASAACESGRRSHCSCDRCF